MKAIILLSVLLFSFNITINAYTCAVNKNGCETCSPDNTKCTKAAGGFYLTDAAGGLPRACPDNVATCTSATVHVSCDPGFYLKLATGVTTGTCTACGGNSEDCTSKADGTAQYALNQCALNSYFKSADNTCAACSGVCTASTTATCTGANALCVAAQQNECAFFSATGACTLDTVTNCRTAGSSAATCNACKVGFIPTAASGTTAVTDGTATVCTACATGCAKCTTTTTMCSVAANGYFWSAANTVIGVQYCASLDAGKCNSCALGYGLQAATTPVCVACGSNALNCTIDAADATKNVAVECETGYLLDASNAKNCFPTLNCTGTRFVNAGSCGACNTTAGCATCNNTKTCATCNNDSSLDTTGVCVKKGSTTGSIILTFSKIMMILGVILAYYLA